MSNKHKKKPREASFTNRVKGNKEENVRCLRQCVRKR